ncbi:MAG: hypothetical protein AB1640_25180 [bacterium]
MRRTPACRVCIFAVLVMLNVVAIPQAQALDQMRVERVFNPLPPGTLSTGGMTSDGEYLYVSCPEDQVIFQIDPDTESVVNRFDWTLSERPFGLAYDGWFYYVSDQKTNVIFVLDKNFGLVTRFNGPEIEQRDMCFTAQGELLVATAETSKIWFLDLRSRRPKEASFIDLNDTYMNQPQGLAFDGQNLWHTNTNAMDMNLMYRMDLQGNILNVLSLPGYVTGLAWRMEDLFGVDYVTGTFFQFDMSNLFELPWADLQTPGTAVVGSPFALYCDFYNEDMLMPDGFAGAFGLGCMFEGDWEYYPFYWTGIYLPYLTIYPGIQVLDLASFPELPAPGFYFVSVLLTAELELVSYDYEAVEVIDGPQSPRASPRAELDQKVKQGLEKYLERARLKRAASGR